jgi:hypothetical protein
VRRGVQGGLPLKLKVLKVDILLIYIKSYIVIINSGQNFRRGVPNDPHVIFYLY